MNQPSRVSLSPTPLPPVTHRTLTRTFPASQALSMYRRFIFGDDQTGLVVDGTDGVTVKGGEDLLLAVDAILGQAGIYVGAVSTTGTFAYPAATVAAWEGFISTATATVLPPLPPLSLPPPLRRPSLYVIPTIRSSNVSLTLNPG